MTSRHGGGPCGLTAIRDPSDGQTEFGNLSTPSPICTLRFPDPVDRGTFTHSVARARTSALNHSSYCPVAHMNIARSLVVLAMTSAIAIAPRTVLACGGCLAPPGAVQSVTDHRMVPALNSTQTSRFEQFSHSGAATGFSWILPIHYAPEVEVRLADNRFMQVLDNVTAPVLQAPAPPGRYCYGMWVDAAATADASDSGVTVYREEVVGPYAVAIIGGADPMAMRTWLGANGYSAPPSINPAATVDPLRTSVGFPMKDPPAP